MPLAAGLSGSSLTRLQPTHQCSPGPPHRQGSTILGGAPGSDLVCLRTRGPRAQPRVLHGAGVRLVLYDRAKLPSPGRCVVALHEGELIGRRIKEAPPRVLLVATDGITPPIWLGQGLTQKYLALSPVAFST